MVALPLREGIDLLLLLLLLRRLDNVLERIVHRNG